MQQPRFFLAFFVLPLFTLLLGWQLGQNYEQKHELIHGKDTGSGTVLQDPEHQADLSMLWGVWRLLLTHYIEPEKLQSTTLIEGAVRGLVAAIGDPYTVFMTPKENGDFRDSLSGHLQGIGAELAVRDADIIVVAAIKGSPAEKAGLLPQDAIVAVDDVELTGLSLQDVVSKIRGPKGTQVTLTVLRPHTTAALTFTIVRDDIHIPSTEYTVKKTATGSVGVLTISQFGTDTIREVKDILVQVHEKDLRGLIIDLRYNGGGYLEGAVDLTSLFLRSGKVVSVERRDKETDVHMVSGGPLLPKIPMVVLINQGTASASEIVAGALQDHKRATVVGMKSFGKGTVQEVIDLPGGSSLRVTIAHWLTPNGKNLGKEGVTPDITVDRSKEDFLGNRDPQMDAAVTWLLGHKMGIKE